MSGTTKSYGDPVALVYTRPRKCADRADGSNCGNKTKMAIIVPTADGGDDGGPTLSCVSLCGACLQDAFVALVQDNMKNGSVIFPFVYDQDINHAIIEAVALMSKAAVEE